MPDAGRRTLYRARVGIGSVMYVALPVDRLDVDENGEPRVTAGTEVVVGREPLVEAGR